MTEKLTCGRCAMYLPNGMAPEDSSCKIYDSLVAEKRSSLNFLGDFFSKLDCLFGLKQDHDLENLEKEEVSKVVKDYLKLYVGGTRNGMETISW